MIWEEVENRPEYVFFLNKLGTEQYEYVNLFLACPLFPSGFFPIFLDLNIY